MSNFSENCFLVNRDGINYDGEEEEDYYTMMIYDYSDKKTMDELKKIKEDNKTERKKSLKRQFRKSAIIETGLIFGIIMLILDVSAIFFNYFLFSSHILQHIGYIAIGIFNIICMAFIPIVYKYNYTCSIKNEMNNIKDDIDNCKVGYYSKIIHTPEDFYIYTDAMKLVIALNMPVIIKKYESKKTKVKRLYQLFSLEDSSSTALIFQRHKMKDYIVYDELKKQIQYRPLTRYEYNKLINREKFTKYDIKNLRKEIDKIPQLSGKQVYELINIAYRRHDKELQEKSEGLIFADIDTSDIYEQLVNHQENLKKEYDNLSNSISSLTNHI